MIVLSMVGLLALAAVMVALLAFWSSWMCAGSSSAVAWQVGSIRPCECQTVLHPQAAEACARTEVTDS
jgi:hypothetical protein